ncbi:MAG TPA: M56 family metallopeptidase, partial [Pirellulales bacterium]
MNGRMLTDFAAGLTPHLPLALAVVSLLLAIGGVALVFVRSPAHRQRVGELTLAAALGWLVLAAIPLPRWLPVADDANGSEVIANEDNSALAPAIRHNVDESAPQFIRHGSATLDPATEPGSSAPEVNPIDLSAAESNSDTSSSVAAAPRVVELTSIDSKAYDSNSAAARAAPSSISSAPKANESEHGGTNRWARAVSFAYLMGVALAGFWLLLGHALLLRERFTAAAPPAWLYRLLHNSVSNWEGRLPRLIVSRRSSRPLSWGVWRPIICLPERICHTANRDQLRTILLHELGHIRRSDARGNLLFELAFPLLFFHPLYWWLRSQVRMAAELVADDWAAGQTGKETYVAQLVALARGSGRRRLLMAGTGVFSSPSQFYRRMQMLLARENPLATRPSKLWRIASAAGLAIAVVMAAALAGNRPAAGQQTDQPAKEPPKPVTTEAPKAGTAPAPTSVIAEAPKNDTAPVAIEVAPTTAAGALPTAKDVPANSAPAATPPLATTPSVAPPTALASDTAS